MQGVHSGSECCPCIVKIAYFHVGDLGWQRGIDIEDWLVCSNTQESIGDYLIGASVAGKEGKCRVSISILPHIIYSLLRELIPWFSKIREEAVECVCICRAA